MKYVILEKKHIGEVMRGERTQLPVHDPAPVGSTIAIKADRKSKPTVLMDVAACEPDDEGYVLTLKEHIYEEVPRLLSGRSPRYRPDAKETDEVTDEDLGYTSQPWLALNDEPQGVDVATLDWLTERAHTRYERHAKTKARDEQRARELLALEERMKAAREAARQHHMDLSGEFRTLRKMRKDGRPEERVLTYLRTVERKAFRDAA